MSAHFVYRELEIERCLVEKYVGRKSVLTQAFSAHRGGQYALFVLAFLAQADGICMESRGRHFFLEDRNRKNKNAIALRETASHVESRRFKEWDRFALVALEMDLPILENMKKIGATGNFFNRHAILHGKSTDCGTLTNSLKALSLLNYVAFGAETK